MASMKGMKTAGLDLKALPRSLGFLFWLDHSAYRILVPQPRIEFVSPAVEVQSLNHRPAGEVPMSRGCILIAMGSTGGLTGVA